MNIENMDIQFIRNELTNRVVDVATYTNVGTTNIIQDGNNLFQTYLNCIAYLKSNAESQNQVQAIDTEHGIYLNSLLRVMEERIGISFDLNSGNITDEDVAAVYTIFVLNIVDTLVPFMISIMNTNKVEFSQRFQPTVNEISVKRARQVYGNKINAILSVNTGNIVSAIIDHPGFLSAESFVNTIYNLSGRGNVFIEKIYTLYVSCSIIITNNTFRNYITNINSNPIIGLQIIEKVGNLFRAREAQGDI